MLLVVMAVSVFIIARYVRQLAKNRSNVGREALLVTIPYLFVAILVVAGYNTHS